MPITTVATNDVLTASHFNTNYRDQVISTTTSGARPAGTEGQFIYETDTNRLLVYTGATWELVYQQGAWTSYTPQIDQGATTNIAKTVTYAKYAILGKTIFVNSRLTLAGTGTATSLVTMTLPITAAAGSGQGIGAANLWDVSANIRYAGMADITSTTQFAILTDASANSGLGAVGFTAALASPDTIDFQLVYEAA